MMAQRQQKIQFHYLVSPFQFPHRTRLKAFLAKQLKGQKKSVECINYIFCSDGYLLELNQNYLRHDTYTDIITFELSGLGEPLISDIYISVDRVRENAHAFGVSFQRELHRVLFHGALHLCGYKDKSTSESKLMRVKEEEWLGEYFVPRGTFKR